MGWIADTGLAEILNLQEGAWLTAIVFFVTWTVITAVISNFYKKRPALLGFMITAVIFVLTLTDWLKPVGDQISSIDMSQAKVSSHDDEAKSVMGLSDKVVSYFGNNKFMIPIVFLGMLGLVYIVRRALASSKLRASAVSLVFCSYTALVVWSRKDFWFGKETASQYALIFDAILVATGIVIIIVASMRVDKAFREGQWLKVLDPVYQKPTKFNASWFWLVFWSFVGFQITLLTIVAGYHWFSFWTWFVTCGLLLVFYAMGTFIMLPPAHMLTWSIFEADRYHPFFYMWRKEKEDRGVCYRIEGDSGMEFRPAVKVGDYVKGFHKGLSFSWFALWLPFVAAYVFPDEEIEIDTYKIMDGLSTKPRGAGEEAGPEIFLSATMVLQKYCDPKTFITLTEADRKDVVGFIKRQFQPLINRCAGQLTIDEIVGEKRLADFDQSFRVDGKNGNLAQLWQHKIMSQMGFAVKTVSIPDQDQSPELKRIQESLRLQESANKLAELKIKEQEAQGKAQIAELISIVDGLADRLAAGDESDAQDRRYALNQWLALNMVKGDNKIFLPMDLLNDLGRFAGRSATLGS